MMKTKQFAAVKAIGTSVRWTGLFVLQLLAIPNLAISSDTLAWSEGVWTSPLVAGVSAIKVQVRAESPQVIVEFKKPKDGAPRSIGVIFIRPNGERTEAELKAIDPKALVPRYQGALDQSGPFIGFELQIPFSSAARVRSNELSHIGGFGHQFGPVELKR